MVNNDVEAVSCIDILKNFYSPFFKTETTGERCTNNFVLQDDSNGKFVYRTDFGHGHLQLWSYSSVVYCRLSVH